MKKTPCSIFLPFSLSLPIALALALSLALASAPSTSAAADFKLTSPGGKITVKIAAGDALLYEVALDGKRVLAPSHLGLEFKDAPSLTGNFTVVKSEQSKIDNTWENPLGKTRQVRDSATELTLTLAEKGDLKRQLTVIFRAYDDAVAFRYVIPKQPAIKDFILTRDASEFHFDADPTVWAADYKAFKSPQESEFVKQPLSKLNQKTPSGAPLLVKVNDTAWVAITEADLTNWAGMWIGASQKRGVLEARLAPRLDKQGLVQASAPCQSPWRVLLIGDRAGALLESNTISNLNPPCAIPDPSWIKPGMMAWDHWWSGDTKMDMPTQKEYIQLAADMGWPYQLVDWHWYGKPNVPGADVTKQAPQMNIPELVQFAKERNVRLWVWTYWSDLEPKMDEAFALYEKWGLAGVKIDFMDRDDQEMVQWYEKTVRKAAEHHLMINFHGAFKPTGMNRTWPNQITREGIMGNEYNKWSKRVTPEHTVTLPFTRYLAGPADFTPGGFLNRTEAAFKTGKPAQVQGTRCHQLAMFVVYDSPVCCTCDHPSNYKGQPGLEFFKRVPTVWDETRVIAGEPGEYIVEVRRSGADWYLGAMTNAKERTVKVPLSFLGAGQYLATMFTDAPESITDAEKLTETIKSLGKADTLEIKMAPAGGAAIRLQGSLVQ